MSNKRKNGYFGESIAEKYLLLKNYEIIEKNYYTPYGEIDIIAKIDDCLVFIEVKLRRSKSYGDALEQLTIKKRERIIKSAQFFLDKLNTPEKECRFDYITLFYEDNSYKVTHIENAFEINT